MNFQGQALRNSHFTLGSTDQKNAFTSTMKMKFQPPSNVQLPASVGEQLNLRGSHFNFGEAQRNYITTQKSHFQGQQIKEHATLNEEQKRELRSNHFVLGHQDAHQVSTNRSTYTQKPLQPNLQNEQDVQKNKMRSHHHDFAETTQKLMQTKYNEEYRPPNHFDAPENLAERAVALRKSNIILGKELLPMKTIQQADYSKKNGQPADSVKQAFQQTHFHLGDAKGDYQTINQEFFPPQKVEANPFAEENRRNLRATHFTLGQDGQPYQTEQSAHYRPHSENKVAYQNHTRMLQATHFTIGDPRFANQKNQTQYKSTMKPPLLENHGQARNQQQDRGSNFVIGSDVKPFTTEFQSNYGNPHGGPSKLNEKLLNDLRSSHFGFHDYQKNHFLTTKQATSIKENGSANQLDPHASANLRSHHFQLGKTDGEKVSQMHDVHRPLVGRPNELNLKQAQNLRKHHFAFS